MVCCTDRSKAVVPVLVLLLVALWFILRDDLLYVFPCVILFLCFSVLLVLRLPRLGRGEGGGGWSWCFSCVCSVCACLDLSVSSSSWGRGGGCGLWLWLSLGFSLAFFTLCCFVVYSTRRFVVCLSVCVILFVCFSVLLVLRLPRWGRES